jgi:integrase
VRKLPSGRWQARYVGPDGVTHRAPTTFRTKGDAQTWLSTRRADITRETWLPEATKGALTVAQLAGRWLALPRARPLKPRTVAHYRALLDRFILPSLGGVKVRALTPEMVEDWHASLDPGTPTYRAHAYSLLRTLMGWAVEKRHATANPCQIRGAGNVKRRRNVRPATLEELSTVVEAMPTKYRPMTLLAAWGALRFGELTELRRRDLDLEHGIVRVRRGVVRADGQVIVGDPKSEAGSRDVAIPPHLVPALAAHMDKMTDHSPGALLFPAADGVSHLAPSTLYSSFYRARDVAGRPDLRWHDLRHTGAVLAAQTGATLAELMGRLGHSTPGAALRYQLAAQGRDAEIARRLSEMVEGRP